MFDRLLQYRTRDCHWGVKRGTSRHDTQGDHVAMAVKIAHGGVEVRALITRPASAVEFKKFLTELRTAHRIETAVTHRFDTGTRYSVREAGLVSHSPDAPAHLSDFQIKIASNVDAGGVHFHSDLLATTVGGLVETDSGGVFVL